MDASVVVLTHNRPKMLGELLEAEFAQAVPAREIVVINNGTDPDTPQVVDRFKCDRIVYKHVPGLSKNRSRNLGFRLASASWVAPIDDDDIHDKQFFAGMRAPVTDGRADLIAADHFRFRDSDPYCNRFDMMPPGYWDGFPKPQEGKDWCFVGAFPLHLLLVRNPFEPGQMLIRKDLLERIGGWDPDFPFPNGDMFEFNARALTAAKLSIVFRPLLWYRIHPGNATASRMKRIYYKLRTFEYIRDKGFYSATTDLAAAIEDDLSKRRKAVFDTAFKLSELDLVRELGGELSDADRNIWRRLMCTVANLPSPVAKPISHYAPRLSKKIGLSAGFEHN